MFAVVQPWFAWLNPRGKKVMRFHRRMLTYSLVIHFLLHSMLWNQILSLDAVCASFRRLRSGGSGWQVDSEKWWPVGTQLLYLWGRWCRSVALINLLHAVGPAEPPSVPPSVPKAALLWLLDCGDSASILCCWCSALTHASTDPPERILGQSVMQSKLLIYFVLVRPDC